MTRIFCIVLLLFIASTIAQTCVDKSAVRFQSINGRLEANGVPITIKGVNWWGTETWQHNQGGLHVSSIATLLDFLKTHKFNGIRVPFALDVILNGEKRLPKNINYNVNPDLIGLNALQVLDKVFEAAAARGILILLDQHRFDSSEKHSAPVWFSYECIVNEDGVCKKYTVADIKAGYSILVNRYQSYWNFMGIDLLNEPHGDARWGTADAGNDWALAAADIGNHVIANHPNWKGMIFVEGVELNPKCEILGFPGCETCENDGHWWGGNLEGVRCAGVALTDQTRLVYSPHVYGVSVYDQAYFSDPALPTNLKYIYDTHFNFVKETGRAVIPGEWGGFYTGKDKIIQDFQASYFQNNGVNGWFYWALNPNPGGDTDGLLGNDWLTPNTEKLAFLATASPNPTSFSVSGSQVCIAGASDPTTPTTTPATLAPTTPATLAPTSSPSTPSPTSVPSDPTSVPSDPTSVPSDPTSVPSDPTSVPSDPTSVPSDPTSVPSDPTSVPSDPTSVPSDPTSVPSDPTSVPSDPTSVPSDPTSVPSDPTSVPSDPTSVPSDPTSNPSTGSSSGQPSTSPTTPSDGTTSGSANSTTAPDQPTTTPGQTTSTPGQSTSGESTTAPEQPIPGESTTAPIPAPPSVASDTGSNNGEASTGAGNESSSASAVMVSAALIGLVVAIL